VAYSLLGRNKLKTWLENTSEPHEVKEQVKQWIFDALMTEPEKQAWAGTVLRDHRNACVTWANDTDVMVTFAYGESKAPIRIPVVILYDLTSLRDFLADGT
jgi:hypothetical protein